MSYAHINVNDHTKATIYNHAYKALFVSASRRRACSGRAARRSEPEVAFRFSPAAVQISRFAAAAFDRSEKNAGRLAGFFRRLASLRRESDYKRSQTGP